MGAFTRDFLKLTERLLIMKEDAKQLLARTNDKLERRLLTQLQAPLDHALCLVDYEHNAELDAEAEAQKALRQVADGIAWAKQLREFPPELLGAMFRSTDAACPECGKVALLGQTTGLCFDCWIAGGML